MNASDTKTDISKFKLGSNDFLIVKVKGPKISGDHLKEVREVIESVIGKGNKILMITDSIDISIVNRTE